MDEMSLTNTVVDIFLYYLWGARVGLSLRIYTNITSVAGQLAPEIPITTFSVQELQVTATSWCLIGARDLNSSPLGSNAQF